METTRVEDGDEVYVKSALITNHFFGVPGPYFTAGGAAVRERAGHGGGGARKKDGGRAPVLPAYEGAAYEL